MSGCSHQCRNGLDVTLQVCAHLHPCDLNNAQKIKYIIILYDKLTVNKASVNFSLCLEGATFPDRLDSFVCVFVLFFQIRSDKENRTNIFYSLKGPGADEPPANVFRVDPKTGYVKIFSILDREKIPVYYVR